MNNSRKYERVYLSKSNQANPDDVTFVRAYLIELGYEIVEHLGGQYKESLLGTCKYMVMVGWDKPNQHGEAFVGKGQYTQFEARFERGYHYNYYYVGTNNVNGKPEFKGVQRTGTRINKSDWARQYSTIHMRMDRAHSALTVISNAPNKGKKSKFNTASDDRTMTVDAEAFFKKAKEMGLNLADGQSMYGSWYNNFGIVAHSVDSAHLGGGRMPNKISLAAVRITRTF